MNNIIEKARSNDAENQPLEAYYKYYEAIDSGEAEREDYINLAVIMFLFHDGGVIEVPEDIANKSWFGMYAILDSCAEKFGPGDDINFWKKYMKLILEGESQQFGSECEEYLSDLKITDKSLTEKGRYLRSLRN